MSVAHFRDDNSVRLLALLGIVSSMPFEFQVRSLLMTNHVSLSVMRAARLPQLGRTSTISVAESTYACLRGDSGAEQQLERVVADGYGLSRETWGEIADTFALDDAERYEFDQAWAA